MSALRLSRRGLFGGFAALLAAPAIVRVASIMPVAPVPSGCTKAKMQDEFARLYTRYSGYDTLNLSLADVEFVDRYDWVQHDVLITADAPWFRRSLA